MELAKITAHGKTTIPKSIRKRANLEVGDVIAFEFRGDHLVVHKVAPGQDEHLRGSSRVLSEWISPEDEDARRDL